MKLTLIATHVTNGGLVNATVEKTLAPLIERLQKETVEIHLGVYVAETERQAELIELARKTFAEAFRGRQLEWERQGWPFAMVQFGPNDDGLELCPLSKNKERMLDLRRLARES